jgi:hypothetical protein
MAKATTTRKKKQPRAKRRVSAWDALPIEQGWHAVQYHIHYMMESKEWINKVKSYIKANYDKKTVAAINKLPDWKVGGKSHYATAAHFEENAPDKIHPDYVGRLDKWIKSLAEEGAKIVEIKKAEEKTKKTKYIPSIQERLMEAAEEKTAEIDDWIDDFLRDPKKGTLKDKMPLNSFRKNEINLGHTRWIQKWFQGPLEELEELVNLPKKNLTEMEKQLQEGYDHLTKPQQKELYEFHKRIFQAMEILRAEKKQTRAVRKPKQKSAQDLVKKMKFKSSDPDLGIASVSPADVVGADIVVVFNCKNRKLGIYYAEDHATIQVKGTTLQFFDETKSVQKTVRKPQEILPNWKKVTKHKLQPQFGYLKTTETKLNGRMNEDIVILKVFKS